MQQMNLFGYYSPGVPLGNSAKLPTGCRVMVYENSILFTPAEKSSFVPDPPKRELFEIKEFSRHSRNRLIHLFTTLQYSTYNRPYLITLTYHNDFPESTDAIQTETKKLFKRIQNFDPDAFFIWRIEFQKRGAIHFHIIYFPGDRYKSTNPRVLQNDFRAIFFVGKKCKCEHCHYRAVKVDALDTYSKATCYVSKYVAKENDLPVFKFKGRRWGYRGELRNLPLKEFNISKDKYNFILDLIKSDPDDELKLKKVFEKIQSDLVSIRIFRSFEMLTDDIQMILYDEFNTS